MMTEMTVFTSNDHEEDLSSEELNGAENSPWVDCVKLRHGMDWLELVTKEVDRDTTRVENNHQRKATITNNQLDRRPSF